MFVRTRHLLADCLLLLLGFVSLEAQERGPAALRGGTGSGPPTPPPARLQDPLGARNRSPRPEGLSSTDRVSD